MISFYDRAGNEIDQDWYYEILRSAREAGEDVRRVKLDDLHDLEVSVSTVWLGSNYGTQDNPLIFETMVFGGVVGNLTERFSTEAEAAAGHDRIVEYVREAEADFAKLLEDTSKPAREILERMDAYMRTYGENVVAHDLYGRILESEAGK